MDGIDAALVRVSSDSSVEFVHGLSCTLDPPLSNTLNKLASGEPVLLDDFAAADTELGEALADAAVELATQANVPMSAIAAIGSHGQTVHHRPGKRHANTLQIGNPSVIAERTRCITVADFRRADMAAGGQGAPLLPALHQKWFASPTENRAVLNLGGIANITTLAAGIGVPTTGFDTGPANTLMDQWCIRHTGKPFDRDGKWASTGLTNKKLLNSMLSEPYLARKPPKSTGRELFHMGWLDAHLEQLSSHCPRPQDVQRTLLAFTVETVRDGLALAVFEPARILVSGGGCHNKLLMDQLNQATGVSVQSVSEFGASPDYLEAMAFAWFAAARLSAQAVLPPSVTGAKHAVVAGAIYDPKTTDLSP